MPLSPSPPLPPRFAGILGDDDWTRLAAHMDDRRLGPGEALVQEGETGRDLFLVLEGEGTVRRGPAEIGRVQGGDLVGELGLLLGRPRAATVTADTALRVGRLSREAFVALELEHPSTGVALAEAFTLAISTRLSEMTESVVQLLSERSVPRRSHVEIVIDGKEHVVATGTRVGALLPSTFEGSEVVAALFDQKALPLSAPLASGGRLAPLTAEHWEGRRVVAESLALLALEAARRVDPAMRARIGPSLGHGRILEIARPAGDVHDALASELDRLIDADLPLRTEWWTVDEARVHLSEAGWAEADLLLSLSRHGTVELASYGGTYALRQGALLASTRPLRGARIDREGDHLLLVMPGEIGVAATPASEARAAARDVRRMLRDEDRFLDALGVDSVGAFNRLCVSGEVPRLVRVVEGFHEKRIAQIADAISHREHAVRVVCIAGPSSTGKTTFIKRLTVQLQVNGLTPHNISLDDYYVDRDATPRDEKGELDFEALEALDLKQLDQDLSRLLVGETVRVPRFDFKAGKSLPGAGEALTLRDGEVLLLEGIHGLNPRLLGSAPTSSVFRVFVCPVRTLPLDAMNRIHASDVRLLRRIVRDRHGRSTPAASSILRWPSVRAGERKHIFPHQKHADAVFDTSLVYELSVLKVYAERYLLEVPRDSPAYTTAHRLLELLDWLVPIYPDHVPPTSILREFIGGSGFEY
jgi:uridine kinase